MNTLYALILISQSIADPTDASAKQKIYVYESETACAHAAGMLEDSVAAWNKEHKSTTSWTCSKVDLSTLPDAPAPVAAPNARGKAL